VVLGSIHINILIHLIIILFQNINGGNGNVNSQWTTVSSLTNAPKWLQRNCGASFAVRKEIYGKQLVPTILFKYFYLVWWLLGVI